MFSGSGVSLTGLTEGQIPTLPQSRITGLETHFYSIVSVLSGITSGETISSLDESKLTGTINNDRFPLLTGDKIPDLDAAKLTGTINNDRIPLLTTTKIPDLDTAKISTGTISIDRIPTLTVPKIPDLSPL